MANGVGVAQETGKATPVGKLEFCFRTVNDGLLEGDGEADGCVLNLIVVGVVRHQTPKIVGIQLYLSAKGLGQAGFVVIPFGGFNQPLDVPWAGIDGFSLGGTGEQNVFERRGLKNAIVGEMQDEVRGREVARDGEARVCGIAVQDELVMIPAEADVDGQVLEADLVLHEHGLLEIGAVGDEREIGGSLGIKLSGVGDVVAEIFVEKDVVGFEAEFPLVAATGDGPRSLEVGFAKEILLEDLDGSGVGIGVKADVVVADHGAKVGERVG